MKQKMIAFFLLFGVITFLFLFPLFAHFLGEKGGVVRLEKAGIEPWFLDAERSKTVLLYFGYVGCTSICIPTLNELSPLYQKIKSRNYDSAFYFVNLNPTQPPRIGLSRLRQVFTPIFTVSTPRFSRVTDWREISIWW